MIKVSELNKILVIDKIIGNPEYTIKNIYPAPKSEHESLDIEGALYWLSERNLEYQKYIKSGVIVCTAAILSNPLSSNCTYIIVENPRFAFKEIAKFFSEKIPFKYTISSTASISIYSFLNEEIYIGNNVVIEDYCRIGSKSIIGHNTVIQKNTVIGKNVKIGCNCTIGGVGFGYEKNSSGDFELIPHLGNVVILDNVEIGNNVTIDRAALGSTILEENVKVDNLVHIAHGVKIRKNSLIIANSMIAGSTEIGENVWVAPSSSIMNGIKIGNNATIGMGAVVLKNVNDKEVIVGNPGKKLVSK